MIRNENVTRILDQAYNYSSSALMGMAIGVDLVIIE